MEEIRPPNYYNYKIGIIVILFNVFSCLARFVSNAFFFLLIHYIDKLRYWECKLAMKVSIKSDEIVENAKLKESLIKPQFSPDNQQYPIFQNYNLCINAPYEDKEHTLTNKNDIETEEKFNMSNGNHIINNIEYVSRANSKSSREDNKNFENIQYSKPFNSSANNAEDVDSLENSDKGYVRYDSAFIRNNIKSDGIFVKKFSN